MANSPNSQMPQRFSGTLNRLSTDSYLVKRKLIGSYVDGRYVSNPNVEQFYIFASIQPTTPQDLFRLPEAERTEDSITIWTETELQMPDAPAGVEGDVLYFGTRIYQVQRIYEWAASGGYQKSIAKKVGQ